MRSTQRFRSARFIVAMMPVLAGCGRASIPATELPKLAHSMSLHPNKPHHLHGIDGRAGTLGRVQTIDLIYTSGQVERVEEPVRAAVPDGRSTLLIRHPSGQVREIPLASIERVDVVHKSLGARGAVGLPLLLTSIPVLLLGSLLVGQAASGDCGIILGSQACGPGFVVGGGLLAVAFGMGIPGGILIARDSDRPTMPSTPDQLARLSALREQKATEPPSLDQQKAAAAAAAAEAKEAEEAEKAKARYWKTWTEAHPADPCSSALASLKGASECVGAACKEPLLLKTGYQRSCHPDPETRIAVHKLGRRWEKEAASEAGR